MHKGFQYANIPLEKHGNETREYNRTGGYNSMGTGLVGTTVWEQGGVRHFVSCLHSSASIDSSFISCVNIHNMSTLGGRALKRTII